MARATPMKPARTPLRERVSPEEWQTRVDLAACYRLVAHYGMTDMIYTHITARVPGPDHHFLINPYGLLFDEINASILVKIDLEGKTVLQPDHDYPVNHAGCVIHSAIHAARADAHCVIHTHTRAGMAVSAQKCGLLPLTQTAMRFYGQVAYHDYEGPAIDLAERASLVRDLGTRRAMILRNHGLLVCAPTVPEAFNTIYWLERACQAQVDALAGGQEVTLPPADVAEKTAHLYLPEVRRPWGVLEWPTMLRLLDRRDPSYRD